MDPEYRIEIPDEVRQDNKYLPDVMLPLLESHIETLQGEYDSIYGAREALEESWHECPLGSKIRHLPSYVWWRWKARLMLAERAGRLIQAKQHEAVLRELKNPRTA